MTPEAWGEYEARTLIMRRAVTLPDGKVEMMLVLFNGDSAQQVFGLPDPNVPWTMLLDSANPEARPVPVDTVDVAAHSVVLLVGWLPR